MLPIKPALLSCILLTACGGGGGNAPAQEPAFGLSQRSAVTALTFPPSNLSSGDVQMVDAFPALSFSQPLFLLQAPGDDSRLFVVEQDGLVKFFANDPAVSSASVFLDLSSRTNATGEEGLLGFAFDPDFASNGYVYAYYIADAGTASRTSVIARYTANAARSSVDRTTELRLFTTPQPYSNHNGGWIGFGPDRMLYVALGDGGSGNDPQGYAQNLSSPLGKMLRLNPANGEAPADNPFKATPGAEPRIWAYGLRNPFRSSFDRATGELWAGDVGQNQHEEIDLITRGGNYGWRAREGLHDNGAVADAAPPGAIDPVAEYDHSQGCSITGGYVYRGGAITTLSGAYLFSDYCTSPLWALTRDAASGLYTTRMLGTIPGNVSSFGEDNAGELYVLSFNGKVYKLLPGTGGSATPFPQTLSATDLFTDTAALTPQSGLIEYELNAPFWSDGTRKRRWIALPRMDKIGFSASAAWSWPLDTVIVKHFEITLADGSNQRLETRVLIHQSNGWQGYTYRWNDAGTEANLLSSAQTITLNTRDEQGMPRTQQYEFPSRADCLRCHTGAAGSILGPRTVQLNRTRTYSSGVSDNQLRALNHINLFDRDIASAAQYGALAMPDSPAFTLSARARAYLDSNCSQCHQPGDPTGVNMDLRAATPAAQMNTHNVAPSDGDLGITGAQRIAPGNKAQSVVWERMRRLDGNRMPPIASHLVDAAGVDLVGAWIDAGAQ